MLLIIDNYDSFTYNLVRYFKELSEEVIIHRNDNITIEEIKKMNIDGIVISPGPKAPKDAGISLEVITEFKGKLPILGICLGHQSIGYNFGGQIIRGKEPVHGKVSFVNHNNKGIFKGIKNPLRVTRYHSLIIEKETLPDELEVTAKTEDNIIMGVRHKEHPIFGVQFHPEAEMTEDGHKLLMNFLSIARSISDLRGKEK